MNLGEMNREQLMYFLEVAQPDMHELEKLNSEILYYFLHLLTF